MANAVKTRASKQAYTSKAQLALPGFKTPFEQQLDPANRWVDLAGKIPWDTLVKVYQKQMHNSEMGADGINPRVVLGAVIIKHMCDFSDEETILQIQENMYMQYFIGFSSYSNERIFDESLFVSIRKRLGADEVGELNEAILKLRPGGPVGREPEPPPLPPEPADGQKDPPNDGPPAGEAPCTPPAASGNKQDAAGQQPECAAKPAEARPLPEPEPCQGTLIADATACPQDVTFPTDLGVLNTARMVSQELVDILYAAAKVKGKVKDKPRTYRKEARRAYLKTAQKKQKTKKEIRKAVRQQLGYLGRNIKHIDSLLKELNCIPLERREYKLMLVIRTVYDQQLKMYKEKTHQADHRIVSVHEPHVRPIVRGKAVAKTEFGAKIQVCLMNGFAFLEDLSWEAFNESTRLMDSVERFKKRFGCYPKDVLADKIYCTRENRKKLKLLGITLKAKPLGRPKAVEAHVRPGERNPIEGKFGQAKTAYGLGRVKARLARTSESWIASIILVLNLVKLAGQVSFYLISKIRVFFATLIREYSRYNEKKIYLKLKLL